MENEDIISLKREFFFTEAQQNILHTEFTLLSQAEQYLNLKLLTLVQQPF